MQPGQITQKAFGLHLISPPLAQKSCWFKCFLRCGLFKFLDILFGPDAILAAAKFLGGGFGFYLPF